MKFAFKTLMAVCSILLVLVSCSHDDLDPYLYVPCLPVDTTIYKTNPLWIHHHDSSLKILAIGNSFTVNSTNHMPWIINAINGDSICIARLVRSSCSLSMHWANHVNNSPDYELYYSDNGSWHFSEINTIDEALRILDWDVIVIQQVSTLSGFYDTYQPYLDNLIKLFREANPTALSAWHYTWAYTPSTKNKEFKKYGRDSEKMYAAIMDAGDKVAENVDLHINSATLIKRMREEFPEVEDGFSDDGIHITDNFAQYALALLWYESLVKPLIATSCLEEGVNLPEIGNPEGLEKIKEIILAL